MNKYKVEITKTFCFDVTDTDDTFDELIIK